MPIYTFENTKTGKVYDDMMTISEKESYLKKNKHIKQLLTTINISSGVRGMGGMKMMVVGKTIYQELQRHTLIVN